MDPRNSGYTYDIPLAWVRFLRPKDKGYEVSVELPKGEKKTISGRIGKRQNFYHALVGCDEYGTWEIPISSLTQLLANRPEKDYPKSKGTVRAFRDYGRFHWKNGHYINDLPTVINWKSISWPTKGLRYKIVLKTKEVVMMGKMDLPGLRGKNHEYIQWKDIRNVQIGNESAIDGRKGYRNCVVTLLDGSKKDISCRVSGGSHVGVRSDGMPIWLSFNDVKYIEVIR